MKLTPEILAWLSKQIGTIADTEQLLGSTSTTLHRVTNTQGVEYVVRLYDNAEWLAIEPDLCEHEAAALLAVESASVSTPKLIAYEVDASVCGVPILLMSKLVGDVWLLATDMQDWLTQSAQALARIHQVDVPDFAWQHYRYSRPHTLLVPTWSTLTDEWQAVIDILQSPEPDAPQHFIHRDYHPTNFLWQDGKLTGIVDWINACVGMIGVDLGHMRCNLAKLYGVDIAEQFLVAYQKANPEFDYDPYWDLVSIGDAFLYDNEPVTVYQPWRDFGITGLSDALVQARAEQFVTHVLRYTKP